MDIIGALARETFDIEVSGTFLLELSGEPMREIPSGNPMAEISVYDDGWSQRPDWVTYREEINGEFKWVAKASEDGVADKETMIRTATLRVRRWDVEGLQSHMRVKRICEGRYYNITHYQDDPGNGLYVMIFLKAVDE